jgi:hypothetical protein
LAQRASVTATTCLEDVDVECTHCRVKMSTHLGSGATVRYFNCPSCHRWVSSSYAEVFRVDAKVRTRRHNAAGKATFDEVKGRLDRWLAAVEDQDPYRTLGVSPMDTAERIRDAYRELAIANHPDRGGDPVRMRQINEAYERIHFHRERRKAEQLEAGRGPSELHSGASS